MIEKTESTLRNRQEDTIGRQEPWVELRSVGYQTFIYDKMVRQASADARAGDVVAVYDRHGDLFGQALYNPNSRIVVRMLRFGAGAVDDAYWREAIQRATDLRRKTLRLDDATNAYRLVHSEGDDLSGLIVDRYDDTLSVEVFSLGMWRRVQTLLPILHEAAGTRHDLVSVDERVQHHEGFKADALRSEALPRFVKIVENGVRFRVNFLTGHKTGFFCDQRENRLKLARFCGGADVLDACCYSGAFGIYAKVLGDAKSVTCVDLDEDAVEAAKGNANLNQVRMDVTHADAFGYMRQMQANERSFGVVVLDPPKFVFGKRDEGEGRKKYADLNALAASVVSPGGVLLTCSCSGAMSRDEFIRLVTGTIARLGRRCQILDVTSAGADHPVSPRCDESYYLKALWLRIL